MALDDEIPLLPGDLFGYESLLDADEWSVVRRTRAFLDEHVAPIAADCWEYARFPHQIVPPLAELGIAGLTIDFEDRPASRQLLTGFLAMEIARVDPSIATFFGVHSGLAMGTIALCGSDEQQQRWLPPMRSMELIGAFGLTEPEGGSDVAGGMRTTAERIGDTWVLQGAKRWIGNATFADLTVIWARDVADDQVKGFVVEAGTPGFTAERIERKYSLRTVQNADITLTDCRVPEANRLQRAESFKDTARVLRFTRGGVAWSAVGTQLGAYDAAVRYAAERQQFGRPIGHFQLVQELLAKMLGNITASLGMAVRVAQLQQDGVFRDEQAALAKWYSTARLRETVAWGREVLGGNGIVLDNDAMRFFADAEALYSYEGTAQMNALIVGRSITGKSAFV
ncbi:acyl-CoA dehydrogenase [Nakamurella sp. YIM 132087]|uniref:Acyl-CoA dehydrogenase n=1 Tax=Nakamurella alba TaxID=2665158 RepID=A0A7K1FNY6_9ACTN|nr:acyl-CoA dehydrogenase family protein [Nakamurella alba]MTD15865.1 acyl-CoA dehydrogenase [Nakamurella alba]